MRSLPRFLMAFLALLSLLATCAPSLAWACPVTGRIGTQREVCSVSTSPRCRNMQHMRGMACCRRRTAPTATNQPCAQVGCCHLVPAPRSRLVAFPFADKIHNRVARVVQFSPALQAVTVAAPHPQFCFRLILYASDSSPPDLHDALNLHSGRAPPVA